MIANLAACIYHYEEAIALDDDRYTFIIFDELFSSIAKESKIRKSYRTNVLKTENH
jgi:hypothetical protein